MDNLAFSLLVTITIFSLMLSVGLDQKLSDLASIWKEPGHLVSSLVAVIVLVPLIAAFLIWMFNLPPAAATGIAVLASAPGAPLTTFRSRMAGADIRFVSSLQISLAGLAIIVTPLTLAAFDLAFDTLTDPVRFWYVFRQVAIVTFLPVVIGLGLRKFAPGIADKIQKPLNIAANLLFLLLVLALITIILISPELRGMLAIGWIPALAIALMICGGLAGGHLLGGPDQPHRAGLAIASIARNIGLAVYIVGLSKTAATAIPVILAYLLIGVLLAMPYTMMSKKMTSTNG
ncbi:MAG: bile acid:sodium symporter family protein [Rhizobiaceae bacterium]